MQIAQIVWLVLIVLFVVLEASTVSLVSIWFCVGALAAFFVSLAAPGLIWLQVLVFVVAAGLSLLGLRPLVRRLLDHRKVPTNADASIGKLCQVVDEVRPGRVGRVKLEGLEWAAVSAEVLPVGAWGLVRAIEGVKLVVVPATPNTNPNHEEVFQ